MTPFDAIRYYYYDTETRKRRLASLGVAFSPLSIALFDAMEVQPSVIYKLAADTFILGLVDAGLWDQIDAIWVHYSHASQAALLNWKDPDGTPASVTGAVEFLPFAGFRGPGTENSLTDAHIDSGFNLSTATNFTRNSAHYGAYILNNRGYGMNWAAGGMGGTASWTFLFPKFTDDSALYSVNDDVGALAPGIAQGATGAVTNGLTVANRSGGNARQAYLRGEQVDAFGSLASGAIDNANLWVAAAHATTGEPLHLGKSADILAIQIVGGSLTSQQQADLNDLCEAFLVAARPAPLWVHACFDAEDESLFIGESYDAVVFHDVGATYAPTGGKTVRDPKLYREPGNPATLYCVHTSGGFNDSNSFGLGKSTDRGRTWSYLGEVGCSALIGAAAGGRCWGPKFYIHTNNDVYVIFSYTEDGGNTGPFQLAYIKATVTTELTTATWGTPTAITGSAIPANVIDGIIVAKIGGGGSELWYKNETSKFIEVVATAVALPLTGYDTVVAADDDLGFGEDREGIKLLHMGGSNWRAYMDRYEVDGAPSIYWSSDDNRATWTGGPWDISQSAAIARNGDVIPYA